MLDSNDLLKPNETLDVSLEGQSSKVTNSNISAFLFTNNHEQSDTRIFWLCTLLTGSVIICCNDTDLLAIALLSNSSLDLDNKTVVLYNRNGDQILVHFV